MNYFKRLDPASIDLWQTPILKLPFMLYLQLNAGRILLPKAGGIIPHQYISGIITNKEAKSLAVGGWKDHVHILFGMSVTTSIADFVGAVKASSIGWINEQGFIKGRFEWQSGYGAFSFARSQRDIVIKYIMNQEEHHRTKTFKEEYLKMLHDFEVGYEERYLFDFYD